LWHKADIEAGLLLCPLLGESGHQPAIAYGATTLSLDQPLPGTDKMEMERRGFGGEVPHSRIFWRALVTD